MKDICPWLRKARSENKTVVVSIYVNPTQFGPKEDLSKLSRDLPRDLAMLEKEGADVVFFPSDKEMYPDGYDTWVTVDNLTKRWKAIPPQRISAALPPS